VKNILCFRISIQKLKWSVYGMLKFKLYCDILKYILVTGSCDYQERFYKQDLNICTLVSSAQYARPNIFLWRSHWTHVLQHQKKKLKVLSLNTQTAASICCISVTCSSVSVQHLNGFSKTSFSAMLCNVLNVFSQNFSRKVCVIFAKSLKHSYPCNLIYKFFLYFEF
jgi:hypothetical protein